MHTMYKFIILTMAMGHDSLDPAIVPKILGGQGKLLVSRRALSHSTLRNLSLCALSWPPCCEVEDGAEWQGRGR